MMKRTLLMMALALGFTTSFSTTAMADGCYICSGGGYAKFKGSDDQSKRKAAKACGCNVSGTRSNCDAANAKILCSVGLNLSGDQQLACNEDKAHDEQQSSTQTPSTSQSKKKKKQS